VAEDAGERAELGLTTTREGASVLIAVAGELDAYSAPQVEALATSMRSEGCTNFTLDLSQTAFIDSSGLRTLVSLHGDLVTAGVGSLTLQSPSDSVARLLAITGLSEHFTVT